MLNIDLTKVISGSLYTTIITARETKIFWSVNHIKQYQTQRMLVITYKWTTREETFIKNFNTPRDTTVLAEPQLLPHPKHCKVSPNIWINGQNNHWKMVETHFIKLVINGSSPKWLRYLESSQVSFYHHGFVIPITKHGDQNKIEKTMI